MGDEANSWLRRTKFSHTVCHRWDTLRLASVPLTIQPDRNPGLKSRPGTVSANQKPGPLDAQIQRNPTTNKGRSASPLPETVLPDTFKEAKFDRKRSTTPAPSRRRPEKGIGSKLFNKDSQGTRGLSSSNTSPLKQASSVKVNDKTKSRKDSSWAKYFDHGGGRVTAVETADDWMVDLSKLFVGLRFAHGSHSRLYHGIYKDEPVAVKIIRVPDDDENGSMAARLEKQFNREVSLLSRLHHQNVIRFAAACREPPVFCVITEYLSEGSLRAYLHKLEHKSLPLEKLISIALDIARGMEYIHSQGVIHRDLKPENILISENFHMKIADFGIACKEAYCDSLADDQGTFRWMAPEMIKHKSYGKKIDVYSFGLILWEMVAGTIPYEDMTPIQAAFAVVNKNLRPIIPGDCAPALRSLIEQCWALQPEKRPEFWRVVKILEQFESLLAHDGNLNLVQNLTCQEHKKGLLKWIQRHSPGRSS
ncbi:serine/threonine/tyrosine-protein kinase HT1 [Malania oleifera]|uniref:serine/threonine/tyrosine-protein kinase HT1 n=1 Tax=Malania oleifera TaxID=397392 RepID=UPI0025AE238A|nr:serine/threonine/tyrosine-protein kinase HT1 [Malania oleifera]XP_057949105.1 serine/threonine/tyrosine-protein kinase HT1 [Malania oleifera]XP_057949106.1 serine/threonine/tyrosine-protein kinase HT1 [Malania oleifera]